MRAPRQGHSMTGRIITPDMMESLIHYQYHGSDASLVLKYVYKPLLERLVLCFPKRMAPNAITAMGAICILTGMVLAWVYSPGFNRPMPWYIYMVNAVLMLSYSFLDNLDGKQARRTRTSSAFGELFDHGVDALACTCVGIMWSAAAQLGSSPSAILLPFVLYTGFYFATWESYWVGGLHLGVVNGPVDGILTLVIAQACGAAFGGEIFTLRYGWWTVGQWATVGTALTGAVVCVGHVVTVWRHIDRQKRLHKDLPNQDCEASNGLDSDGYTLRSIPPSFRVALQYLLPFIIFFVSSAVWVIGNAHPMHTRRVTRFGHLSYYIMFFFVFGHLGSSFTLAHLCGVPYRVLSWVHLPHLAAAANTAMGTWSGTRPPMDLTVVAVGSTAVVVVGCLVWYCRVISEVTEGLGLNIVSLTPDQLSRMEEPDPTCC